MTELASEVKILRDLPAKGLKEGPYLFERNGIYYLTYPHVETKIERLEYAISDNPLGPFKVTGVIMDEAANNCWTNHHSVIQFKNQWYLFYHNKDYSPNFDKARSVRADSLFFNADGTIKKVMPTFRGVGVTKATSHIQMDRYSQLSEKGAAVDFIDTLHRFQGWKTILSEAGAWVQYNSVDFGTKPLKTVTVNAMSANGGTLQIRTGSAAGPVIGEIKIPAGNNWKEILAKLTKSPLGLQHLFLVLKNGGTVETDWLSFK